MVTAKLHSNDWRERANALAELVRLAADHPDFVSAYSTQVMDELAKKIGDPNWKVLLRVDALSCCVAVDTLCCGRSPRLR